MLMSLHNFDRPCSNLDVSKVCKAGANPFARWLKLKMKDRGRENCSVLI
jgi:hypothetical protein